MRKALLGLLLLVISTPCFADDLPYILGGGSDGTYKVTIDADYVDADLTNYIITINLDGSSFPFENVTSGNNIRVMDGTLTNYLTYDLEYYDSGASKGVIHVKVPSVSGSTDTVLYLVYSGAFNWDASDPEEVWSDYSAVYHMADSAFTNGVISDGNFPVCSLISGPSAYYYNGKTYYAYNSLDGKVYVRTFTHSSDTWSDAVEVGTNPIAETYPDGHGMMACTVDSSGYVWVGGANHVSAMKVWKSNSTEDISAWTAQADLSATSTYTSFIRVGNDIYCTYRGPYTATARHPWTFRKYSGGSWGAETNIITIEADNHLIYSCYPAYDATNHKIWLAWRVVDGSISDGGQQSHDIYLAYMLVDGSASDGHMFDIAGNDLGTAITETEATSNCRITTGTQHVWGVLVKLDSSGNPYVMYPRSSDASNTAWNIVWKYWTGSTWSDETTVHLTASYWTHFDFTVTSSSSATAFYDDENNNVMKSAWDGTKWSVISDLSSIRDIGELYALQYVEGGQSDMKILINFEKTVIALDSVDAFVPRSGFSLGRIKDQSEYPYSIYKKAATEPTQATGKLGYGMDFDGTDDYANTFSRIFDYPDDTGGTVQILLKTPTAAELASSSRCPVSVNYEDDDLGSRFDLTFKDSDAGQAYDGKLYLRVKPNGSDTIIGYSTSSFGGNLLQTADVTGNQNSAATSGNNYAIARKFTVPAAGMVITRLSNTCYKGTGDMTHQMEIWTDNAGTPGSLVSGTTVTITTPSSPSQEVYTDLSSPVSLTAGATYWVVRRLWNASAFQFYQRYYDSGSGETRAYATVDSSTGVVNGSWTVSADATIYILKVYGYTKAADAYHLIGISQDATDGNKLWVDGTAETVTYTTGAASTKDWFDDFPIGDKADVTWWYLGKRKDGTTNDSYYSSIIDTVRFMNRKRSAAEWTADYHGLVVNDLLIYGN